MTWRPNYSILWSDPRSKVKRAWFTSILPPAQLSKLFCSGVINQASFCDFQMYLCYWALVQLLLFRPSIKNKGYVWWHTAFPHHQNDRACWESRGAPFGRYSHQKMRPPKKCCWIRWLRPDRETGTTVMLQTWRWPERWLSQPCLCGKRSMPRLKGLLLPKERLPGKFLCCGPGWRMLPINFICQTLEKSL